MPVVVVGQKVSMRIEHQDFGQFRQHRINRVHVKLAEVFCKPALLLRGERLTPEEQDLVFDQQFTEAVDGRRRQFFRERDAPNFGAKRGGQAGNGNGHGAIMPCGPTQARAAAGCT